MRKLKRVAKKVNCIVCKNGEFGAMCIDLCKMLENKINYGGVENGSSMPNAGL